MPNQPVTTMDPLLAGLAALGALLAEPARAERLLATTGLDAATLRARAQDPQLLAAVIGFLEAHEPDLVAVAEAAGLSPEMLVSARRMLEGSAPWADPS
jgi:2-hydroxychromene-2-carboxylate isomerase